MKYLTIAIIGIASVKCEKSKKPEKPLFKDDKCSIEHSKCARGLCCGIAEHIVENGSEETANKSTICNF